MSSPAGKGRPGRPAPPPAEPLDVPVTDSHCHLDFVAGVEHGSGLSVAEVVARAQAVGVTRMVTIGTDLESSQWSADCAAQFPGVVYAGVAVHPNDAHTADDATIAGIARLAALPQVRAVGETGLDYYRDWCPPARQQESFRAHIDLAKQVGKALVIHDRDAHADVLRLLAEEGAPDVVVFHCFSGDLAFARRCVERGYVLSFAGTLTYRNADDLREAAAWCPADELMVETDAPFLPPVPHRGKPSAPDLVPLTVRALAAVRGEPVETVAEAVRTTADRVFGLVGVTGGAGPAEGTAPSPVTIADYESAAMARLEPAAYDYYAGGAGDERTLVANRAAWADLTVVPRMLVDVSRRDLTTTVLGRSRPHPVVVAPTAFHHLAHQQAEIATATGAAWAGAVMCVSTLASRSVTEVAEGAPAADRWFQVYVLRDRGATVAMVHAAAAAGYEALVLTVDAPIFGRRERDLRRGFGVAWAPAVPGRTSAPAVGLTMADVSAQFDQSLTWADLAWLVAASPLPVLVKGVLSATDARLAVEHGAAGVVVSNHGGRQLDGTVTTAAALPAVVAAVGDRVDVLVDGGIRRGLDVVRARALGASAVLVGRPVLWGLATAGADGVAAVLRLILDEVDLALALLGVPSFADVDRSCLA